MLDTIIKQLADKYFTKYDDKAISVEPVALSSTMYHKRLCEDIKKLILETLIDELDTLKVFNEDDFDRGRGVAIINNKIEELEKQLNEL